MNYKELIIGSEIYLEESWAINLNSLGGNGPISRKYFSTITNTIIIGSQTILCPQIIRHEIISNTSKTICVIKFKIIYPRGITPICVQNEVFWVRDDYPELNTGLVFFLQDQPVLNNNRFDLIL